MSSSARTELQPVEFLTKEQRGAEARCMAYLPLSRDKFHRPAGPHVLQDTVTFCSTDVKSWNSNIYGNFQSLNLFYCSFCAFRCCFRARPLFFFSNKLLKEYFFMIFKSVVSNKILGL